MSRRTKQCIGCDGRTRHKDRRCARCRKLAARLLLSGELKVWFMPTLPDDLMRAPTARMLNEHGRRIEGLLLPEQRRPLSYRGRGG